MLNYWWVTRPKRKLNSIPDVLATFSELSLDQEWQGQRDSHLSLEDALESAGLKRIGERRDQTGGGARTYKAWVVSLGLIFTQKATRNLKLTMAGEAIMAGDSPISILKNQVLKYQFPSSFSLSRGVNVAPRFKIHPFIFLLKLLADKSIVYLTAEEIAKIVMVEAENETESCYKYIVNRILEFRTKGDACLEKDFFKKYGPSKSEVNPDHPFSHLLDIGNTLINWLDYTQLINREKDGKAPEKIQIAEEKLDEVLQIISAPPNFIDRPDDHEFFQRKYGLDPKHKKDTRNLSASKTITAQIIAEHKVKQAYITESLRSPITKITASLIETIAEKSGINEKFIEETLQKFYPHGSIGSFMTEYHEMAFRGRDDATDFEKATVHLFAEVFGFKSKHVGPIGLTPDVLILSDESGYQAIIDNKAYSKYTINNDHYNRMVHNYIENIRNYSDSSAPLAFFTYIAGGFGSNINPQLQKIVDATKINGSAMTVNNMISLVEKYPASQYDHKKIRDIFSVNRQVLQSDL